VIDPAALTARWRRVAGANRYHVQLSENSAFQTVVVNDSTLTDTLRQIGPLKSGTTYYFRVRARGVSYWSTFGATIQFLTSTPPPPAAPSMVTPGQGTYVDPQTVTARWSRVPKVSFYHLQLAENSSFLNPMLNDSSLTDTMRVVTSLESGTTYYIRVRAKGATGTSSYSATVQFSTKAKPLTAPPLLSPDPGSIVEPPTVTIRWGKVEAAVRYHLQVFENNFENHLVNDSTLVDTLRIVNSLREGSRYYIQLRSQGAAGWSGFTEIFPFTTSSSIFVSVSSEKPRDWYLAQNFPNPFNPSTTIRFGLREAARVQLCIYNTLGQLVNELVRAELAAGTYDVRFDASRLPSGVYICRIQAGEFVSTRRLLLVK
jgi:hypothetical protein